MFEWRRGCEMVSSFGSRASTSPTSRSWPRPSPSSVHRMPRGTNSSRRPEPVKSQPEPPPPEPPPPARCRPSLRRQGRIRRSPATCAMWSSTFRSPTRRPTNRSGRARYRPAKRGRSTSTGSSTTWRCNQGSTGCRRVRRTDHSLAARERRSDAALPSTSSLRIRLRLR